jgi:hypothetical protein
VTITPRRGEDASPMRARVDALVADPLVRARLHSLIDTIESRPQALVALEHAAGRNFFALTREGDVPVGRWTDSIQSLPGPAAPARR